MNFRSHDTGEVYHLWLKSHKLPHIHPCDIVGVRVGLSLIMYVVFKMICKPTGLGHIGICNVRN